MVYNKPNNQNKNTNKTNNADKNPKKPNPKENKKGFKFVRPSQEDFVYENELKSNKKDSQSKFKMSNTKQNRIVEEDENLNKMGSISNDRNLGSFSLDIDKLGEQFKKPIGYDGDLSVSALNNESDGNLDNRLDKFYKSLKRPNVSDIAFEDS